MQSLQDLAVDVLSQVRELVIDHHAAVARRGARLKVPGAFAGQDLPPEERPQDHVVAHISIDHQLSPQALRGRGAFQPVQPGPAQRLHQGDLGLVFSIQLQSLVDRHLRQIQAVAPQLRHVLLQSLIHAGQQESLAFLYIKEHRAEKVILDIALGQGCNLVHLPCSPAGYRSLAERNPRRTSVPLPGTDSIAKVPPILSIMRRVTHNPMPLPPPDACALR